MMQPRMQALFAATLLLAGLGATFAAQGTQIAAIPPQPRVLGRSPRPRTSAGAGESPEEQPPLPCAAHTTCRDCTADINCGWCASDSVCYEGVEMGPIFGSCARWAHTFCHGAPLRGCAAAPAPSPALRPPSRGPAATHRADEPCADRLDCHSCLVNPKCGWCAFSSTCEEGSAAKSDESACPPSHWVHKHGVSSAQCRRARALKGGK